MGSLTARALVEKVKKTVISGDKVVLTDLSQEVGYSRASSYSQKGVSTKTFKEGIKELDNWFEKEIRRIQNAMANKDLNEEEYKDLTKSLDIIVKNDRLLQGKSTEIVDNRMDRLTDALINLRTKK